MKFKAAVMFRRSMLEGGLTATMMPGVFENGDSLADAIKTHKALTNSEHVYIALDVEVDEKRNPVSVQPI